MTAPCDASSSMSSLAQLYLASSSSLVETWSCLLVAETSDSSALMGLMSSVSTVCTSSALMVRTVTSSAVISIETVRSSSITSAATTTTFSGLVFSTFLPPMHPANVQLTLSTTVAGVLL